MARVAKDPSRMQPITSKWERYLNVGVREVLNVREVSKCGSGI